VAFDSLRDCPLGREYRNHSHARKHELEFGNVIHRSDRIGNRKHDASGIDRYRESIPSRAEFCGNHRDHASFNLEAFEIHDIHAVLIRQSRNHLFFRAESFRDEKLADFFLCSADLNGDACIDLV